MKEIIKKRTIKVVGMTCEGCAERIKEALSEIDGVKDVRIKKMGVVQVIYDLMKVPIKIIENEIVKLGYDLPESFWQKALRGWLHYAEETEYKNMKLPERPCCSKPPGV